MLKVDHAAKVYSEAFKTLSFQKVLNCNDVLSREDKNSIFGVHKSEGRNNCAIWCDSLQWPSA